MTSRNPHIFSQKIGSNKSHAWALRTPKPIKLRKSQLSTETLEPRSQIQHIISRSSIKTARDKSFEYDSRQIEKLTTPNKMALQLSAQIMEAPDIKQ